MKTILFFAAFLIAAALSPILQAIALRVGLVDKPDGKRKKHDRPTPLLGGWAVVLAIALVAGVVLLRSDLLTAGAVTVRHYLGLGVGLLIVMIGGTLDDRYNFPARVQILFPVVAALVAVFSGLEVIKMTNPLGGYFLPGSWSSLLVFLWLLIMMETTKLLDGLDGLATSVGAIGSLMVLLLASSVAFFQPDIVSASAIVLGALLGFLVWNIHPARLFLGEGGSLAIGYLLGALAVLGGSKIATLLLVMGIPLLDVVWVVVNRLRQGRGAFSGDRTHLHHRLADAGLSQNQIVFFYTALAFGFGSLTLVLSSFAKLLALLLLGLVMFTGAFFLLSLERKKRSR